MFTIIRFESAVRKAAGSLAVCLFATCFTNAAFAGAPTDDLAPRRSTSMQYADGGRAKSSPAVTTENRYGELVTDGGRIKPGKQQAGSKPGSVLSKGSGNDFWIYFADVVLFNDDDNDGYFYGIDLLFDADTYYEVADVYAVLYLSLEGGPWNEYAVTEDFSIFGATSDDEYVVVTELESGYPTGSYDLLIELYDAVDGTFLASLGPADTSELSFLRLEDFNRDDPHFDVPIAHSHGGGAADPSMIVVLLGLIAATCFFQRRGQKQASQEPAIAGECA